MTRHFQLNNLTGLTMAVFVLLTALLTMVSTSRANDIIVSDSVDAHKTELGSWDIHVCNWPDRPPFYLTTFKTEQYENIQSIEVFSPTGHKVGNFNVDKFLTFQREGLPDLIALITQLPLVNAKPSGWFSAHINTKDGRRYLARDYLIMEIMQRVSETNPAHMAEISVPTELSWTPVRGANHHRVWIRDMWEGGKQIFDSGYIQASKVEMPEGLLQTDGWYSWRIHSRDTHGHVLLGDFNHGSLTDWKEFNTLVE